MKQWSGGAWPLAYIISGCGTACVSRESGLCAPFAVAVAVEDVFRKSNLAGFDATERTEELKKVEGHLLVI